MSTQLVIYSISYALLCVCVLYPPDEFLQGGFTINNLFSYWLGSEFENFIAYHVKRMSLTLILYSLLPMGYIFFLSTFSKSHQETYFLWSDNDLYWSIFATITIILPLTSLSQILTWSFGNWNKHPIAVNLAKFAPNWMSVARDVNVEYRSINKIVIHSNAITKLIATENWIIKMSALSFDICHHSDTSLLVIDSDVHDMSMQGNGQNQFITIKVKTTRPSVADFTVRLNSNDFKDLEDRWGRAIPILPEIKFHKNIIEKFVDAFKGVVKDNVRYFTEQEPDYCIGCMQTRANVKLQRNCIATNNLVPPAATEALGSCANCYCRPLWCCDCLGKWFATKQSSKEPNEWMAAQCSCPMCRARFCVLDVCFVEGPNTSSSDEDTAKEDSEIEKDDIVDNSAIDGQSQRNIIDVSGIAASEE